MITQRCDATADRVVTSLIARGAQVVRCDIADFPQRLTVRAFFDGVTGWRGTLESQTWRVNLADITAAYYRRPTHVEVSTAMTADDRRWSASEALAGFGGLLATITTWLNHPTQIGFAEYKPVQLAEAARAGLATPATVITNEPEAAATFIADTRSTGGAVYKAFSSAASAEGERRFIYASRLTEADIVDHSVAHTAHLFQQWVNKAYDVRVTIVDDQLFAARIDSTSERAAVDWRADYAHLGYTIVDTPKAVAKGIRSMLGALGLRFAALDFAVTHDGEWVFLDLNPNGQWLWIEHATGLPICEAITDALLR